MGFLTSWLRQVVAVTLFNLASLRHRSLSSLVVMVGVAGVVLVLIGVLSIATGFRKTLDSTGDPENVMVLRAGSDAEMNSGLSLETTRIIGDAPQLARLESRGVASAELFVIIDLNKSSTDTPANVPLRGVDPEMVYPVRGEVNMIAGRPFLAGRNEVVVGRGAVVEFSGLGLGAEIDVGEGKWVVVGHFDTGGTAADSEIWCDAKVLQPAYRRGSGFQSVHARLADAESFSDFKDALTSDPRLDVKVIRESDYYAQQSRAFTGFITVLGGLIGGLMGIGAIFGALNTMYTAVSARSREIATLRALGFSSGPVVISVMVEAMLLATLGGVLGAAIAYGLFHGYQAATLNFQTFSQIAFEFAVTPKLMALGIFYSLLMGFIGGFFPAIRAARLPVATALREL
jgi:putative ABC transport system permease protein